MRKEKINSLCYECKKCNKTLYYRSNEEYSTICKTCGSELVFLYSKPYTPKNSIKMANAMNKSVHTRQANINTNSIHQHQPKCPTCGSTKVQRIGTGEKIVSGALWGLFSNKVHKSYKCNNCKYMW